MATLLESGLTIEQALAAADRQSVLQAWSGLGYYRRAENLKKAARQIVRQHGGAQFSAFKPALSELAVEKLAPRCATCGTRVIGHGLQAGAEPRRIDCARCKASYASAALCATGAAAVARAWLSPEEDDLADVALVVGGTASVLGVVMLLLITWLFLFLRSVPERWLQTSTALAGTGIIFSLLAFPLFYMRVFVQGGPTMQAFIGMLIIFLVLWNIAVMTHILKNALSSSYVLGVLGSLTYIAMITFTLQVIVPAQGAA